MAPPTGEPFLHRLVRRPIFDGAWKYVGTLIERVQHASQLDSACALSAAQYNASSHQNNKPHHAE